MHESLVEAPVTPVQVKTRLRGLLTAGNLSPALEAELAREYLALVEPGEHVPENVCQAAARFDFEALFHLRLDLAKKNPGQAGRMSTLLDRDTHVLYVLAQQGFETNLLLEQSKATADALMHLQSLELNPDCEETQDRVRGFLFRLAQDFRSGGRVVNRAGDLLAAKLWRLMHPTW